MTAQAATHSNNRPGPNKVHSGPFLCISHVRDAVLKAALDKADNQQCKFCSSIGPAVTLESVEREVKEAITFKYRSIKRKDHPKGSAMDGNPYWNATDSEEAMLTICDRAFNDEFYVIIAALNESFDEDERWLPKDVTADPVFMSYAWREFAKNTKEFAKNATGLEAADVVSKLVILQSVFLNSLSRFLSSELELITEIPAQTGFFRGRIIEAPVNGHNDAKKLGPAPAEKAAANRMSPSGTPMFYASAEPDTAVKEIASHDVYNYARIGKFVSQKTLKVLDLTKAFELTEDSQRPSPFAPKNKDRSDLLEVICDFATNVSRPIIPDGRQHIDYVPTQVITEFFRTIPTQHLDGIKLKSSQDGKDTFVLFFTADDVADSPTSPGQNAIFTLLEEDVFIYAVKREIEVTLTSFKSKRF